MTKTPLEMKLSEEELLEVKELAGLFFDIREIAFVLERDPDDFLKEYESEGELFKAYQGAMLKSEAEVRKSIIDFAKAGSSPAQTMAKQYIEAVKFRDM